MGKMVVRLIPYGLLPTIAILLGVGAALAEGMQTFTNEQAALRHCPADTIVWLNTSSANYHFKPDSPNKMPVPNLSSGANPPTLFWPNSTDALYYLFDSVH